MGQLNRRANNKTKKQPRPTRKTFPTIGKLLYLRRQVSSLKPGECIRYQRERIDCNDFGQCERPGWTVEDMILEGIPGATYDITCRLAEDSVTFCRLKQPIRDEGVRAHVLPDSREKEAPNGIRVFWRQAIDGLWYRSYEGL